MTTVWEYDAPTPEEVRRLVAKVVRSVLAQAGIDQKSLGGWLGISQQQAGERLRGNTEFRVRDLILIAAHTGVPIEQLLGEAALQPVDERNVWPRQDLNLRPMVYRSSRTVSYMGLRAGTFYRWEGPGKSIKLGGRPFSRRRADVAVFSERE